MYEIFCYRFPSPFKTNQRKSKMAKINRGMNFVESHKFFLCSNFYMATLINDMSAQPAFMYSFDYLSGSKSNRTISRSFKSLACQAAGKSLTSTVSTLAMQRMSLMVLFNYILKIPPKTLLELEL